MSMRFCWASLALIAVLLTNTVSFADECDQLVQRHNMLVDQQREIPAATDPTNFCTSAFIANGKKEDRLINERALIIERLGALKCNTSGRNTVAGLRRAITDLRAMRAEIAAACRELSALLTKPPTKPAEQKPMAAHPPPAGGAAASTGGRSGDPPKVVVTTLGARGHGLWSGRKQDCNTASPLEMRTAAWFTVCAESSPKSARDYTPSISPQKLTELAGARCGTMSRETAACHVDAKVSIVLENIEYVRKACSGLRGSDLLQCVDIKYVMGPGSDFKKAELNRLRHELGQALANQDPVEDDISGVRDYDPPRAKDGCGPGQGMKPTPGAFGAWSCQALGSFTPLTAPAHGAGTESEPESLQQQVNGLARLTTTGASVMTPPAADNSKDCARIAFLVVRSLMQGGRVAVPEPCRSLSEAARLQLRRYAAWHLDARPTEQIEEVLAQLNPQDQRVGIVPRESVTSSIELMTDVPSLKILAGFTDPETSAAARARLRSFSAARNDPARPNLPSSHQWKSTPRPKTETMSCEDSKRHILEMYPKAKLTATNKGEFFVYRTFEGNDIGVGCNDGYAVSAIFTQFNDHQNSRRQLHGFELIAAAMLKANGEVFTRLVQKCTKTAMEDSFRANNITVDLEKMKASCFINRAGEQFKRSYRLVYRASA